MSKSEFVAFRVSPEHNARITELATHVGTRTDFMLLALALADETMTLADLKAHGVIDADARVQVIKAAMCDTIDALTHNPKRKPRQDTNPDGVKSQHPRSEEAA